MKHSIEAAKASGMEASRAPTFPTKITRKYLIGQDQPVYKKYLNFNSVVMYLNFQLNVYMCLSLDNLISNSGSTKT